MWQGEEADLQVLCAKQNLEERNLLSSPGQIDTFLQLVFANLYGLPRAAIPQVCWLNVHSILVNKVSYVES